jgi:hypothetical protein
MPSASPIIVSLGAVSYQLSAISYQLRQLTAESR